jgi:hypothetical protein
MVVVLAADNGTSVQVLLVILSGLFALFTAVYVAIRNSRAEHRRWLRQERLKAYSSYSEIASSGLEAIDAMLMAFLHTGEANAQAIVRRAEQTSADLHRPAGIIRLLGPQHVNTAAGAVRYSLHWSVKTVLKAIAELDEDGKLMDPPSTKKSSDDELPKLEADGQNLFKRAQEASEALHDFNRLAADGIQGRGVRSLFGHIETWHRRPWKTVP